MTASSIEFRDCLQSLLEAAPGLGLVAVEVNAGNLHRKVGGYPGQDHRMPICCELMYKAMIPGDEIVAQPAPGKGAPSSCATGFHDHDQCLRPPVPT